MRNVKVATGGGGLRGEQGEPRDPFGSSILSKLSVPRELVAMEGRLLSDKYRIEQLVGYGGMGAVFRGVHLWTDRQVAIKTLLPRIADTRNVKRFIHEGKAGAKLTHPNVVDVLDMGEDDGLFYMVLEFLRGETLSDFCEREGPLSLSQAHLFLAPIMDALVAAHGCGMVHRDLKPRNVFLAENGHGGVHPKLLDFGIVKVSEGTLLTQMGEIVGTPCYMAPEQADGSGRIGPQVDIWAMGMIFFQCLTGVLPFRRTDPAATIAAILGNRAPPILNQAPDLNPRVAAIIDRALERSLDLRYSSMAQLAAELGEAIGGYPGAYIHQPVDATVPMRPMHRGALERVETMSLMPTRVERYRIGTPLRVLGGVATLGLGVLTALVLTLGTGDVPESPSTNAPPTTAPLMTPLEPAPIEVTPAVAADGETARTELIVESPPAQNDPSDRTQTRQRRTHLDENAGKPPSESEPSAPRFDEPPPPPRQLSPFVPQPRPPTNTPFVSEWE